jgi:hypothetical protein
VTEELGGGDEVEDQLARAFIDYRAKVGAATAAGQDFVDIETFLEGYPESVKLAYSQLIERSKNGATPWSFGADAENGSMEVSGLLGISHVLVYGGLLNDKGSLGIIYK